MSEAERAARIEQLLLSGLDQYFGGNYEQAINVWTRVAFLERGHGRARAYIERARSALAERQRESEEYLHNGVAAYQAGDLGAARELLTRAVEQGGTNETALLFLQRLGRLDATTEAPRAQPVARSSSTRGLPAALAPARRISWPATIVVSLLLASVIILGALGTASWLRERPVTVRTGEPAPAEPLPIVRASQIRIDRARGLRAAGRPVDALRELAGIELGDPSRLEAERLRSDIQRALLSGATAQTVAKPEELTR
jgi:uncharacterized iron-regulated membrane protein